MNKIIQSLIKEVVEVEISGKKLINGTIIDLGSDIFVLFNGANYMYIPLNHVQSLRVRSKTEYDILDPIELPGIIGDENKEDLSLIEVLAQAKENNVEIFVTNDKTLHGYIMQIKDNYFEFFSPIYKTMYISIKHLKWLIPYSQNEKPYGLDYKKLPLQISNELLASTFEAQVENLKDTIVVLNIGGSKSHIGKINNVHEQIIEIQGARSHSIYLNLDHIKTLHKV
ncbi:DUF2642 domain-containing protein [Psychrobacillus sp. NPDC058041]|uniref:DUF2642 domain-containing protein n=1 Tax=Psychrobacillus sp. NPDC058041 TaxID=3346310 RepID=UPI0036DDEB16